MKKIMFNERYGLQTAVLDRLKNNTRRIIPQSGIAKAMEYRFEYYEATFDVLTEKEALEQYYLVEKIGKLPYKVGEVVAIAQSYASIADFYQNPINASCAEHYEQNLIESGWYCCEEHPGFRNKLFVAADRMIHHICITDVKIEQLSEISDADCLREGVLSSDKYAMPYGIPDRKAPNGVFFYYSSPREAFAALINRISGKGTWESNPWVFAYEFELVD